MLFLFKLFYSLKAKISVDSAFTSVTELKGFICMQTSKPNQMWTEICSQECKGLLIKKWHHTGCHMWACDQRPGSLMVSGGCVI